MTQPQHSLKARISALTAALVLFTPQDAGADRTLQLFEPTGGVVVPFGPRATASTLGVIGYTLPLPFDLSNLQQTNADDAPRRIPVVRILLDPEVIVGRQPGQDPSNVTHVTFRLHPSLRLVVPLAGRFDLLSGLGSTIEFWPLIRPSVSPQLGTRLLLRTCEHDFKMCLFRYATFSARADFFASGNNSSQIAVLAGFSSL